MNLSLKIHKYAHIAKAFAPYFLLYLFMALIFIYLNYLRIVTPNTDSLPNDKQTIDGHDSCTLSRKRIGLSAV